MILGHRRQRNFERIFFFVCLALLFFFGCSLLELNAQLYYTSAPKTLAIFAWTILCLGLWFLPSLLLHLHVEYADIRSMIGSRNTKRIWILGAYAPVILLLPYFYRALNLRFNMDFDLPGNSLGIPFQIWLVLALTVCAVCEGRFRKVAPDQQQGAFHRELRDDFFALALLISVAHIFLWYRPEYHSAVTRNMWFLALVATWPLFTLVRNVQRFNFFQIGRQRNLIYAVFATFVALLYLSLIRRASLWMEPYLPPEATAAILLFLPVVFFEPLQRLMRGILRRTAQTEMDHAQRMMAPIQEVARLGNLGKLTAFVEKWVGDELQVAKVELSLGDSTESASDLKASEEVYPIRQSGRTLGTLRVKPHGAMISGETIAALEFLCEQLPGALDLCRLIEEKLRLERELAERERLAVLGQMAASISHNLKNPLGSIKTILQVQLESPEMPEAMRAETRMVLDEIARLSSKLNQLLQFSRPAVRGGTVEASCCAHVVAEEVSGVLKHDAERRGVGLAFEFVMEETRVAASAEALNEILSNLVVNALEATPRGGHVKVSGRKNGDGYVFTVEDDGPGVPEGVREKILQPFFTTKTQGTGLGLAIVARRVAEFGGNLEWKSPVVEGRGTRFEVTIPMRDGAR